MQTDTKIENLIQLSFENAAEEICNNFSTDYPTGTSDIGYPPEENMLFHFLHHFSKNVKGRSLKVYRLFPIRRTGKSNKEKVDAVIFYKNSAIVIEAKDLKESIKEWPKLKQQIKDMEIACKAKKRWPSYKVRAYGREIQPTSVYLLSLKSVGWVTKKNRSGLYVWTEFRRAQKGKLILAECTGNKADLLRTFKDWKVHASKKYVVGNAEYEGENALLMAFRKIV